MEVRQILLAVVVLRGQLVMQVAAVVAIARSNQLVWLLPRRFELTGLRYLPRLLLQLGGRGARYRIRLF